MPLAGAGLAAVAFLPRSGSAEKSCTFSSAVQAACAQVDLTAARAAATSAASRIRRRKRDPFGEGGEQLANRIIVAGGAGGAGGAGYDTGGAGGRGGGTIGGSGSAGGNGWRYYQDGAGTGGTNRRAEVVDPAAGDPRATVIRVAPDAGR